MSDGNTQRNDPTIRTAASSGRPQFPPDRPGGRIVSAGCKDPGLPKRAVTIRWTGFGAGLVAAVLMFALLPASIAPEARATAAASAGRGVGARTEAIPA